MRNMTMRNPPTKPRFARGQKVIIKPVNENGITARENSVNEYAGQVGEVSTYYWINPRNEQIFYIYRVKVGKETKKEIVVYEDELEPGY
jgi:spore germination protein GerM